MTAYRYLATCPTGIGTLLMQELASLGADDLIEKPVGVSFSGDLALAYRVCLWSRLARECTPGASRLFSCLCFGEGSFCLPFGVSYSVVSLV